MTDSIYDHPLYYDILFGWDRRDEAAFYDRVLERSGIGRTEPVLEVACGTGRIALALAAAGRSVTGLDVRPGMLAFLSERAASAGLHVGTLCADMTAFAGTTAFGAAYNPMSSFRLLRTDQAAEAHLRAVGEALRPGGIYVLDMAFQAAADAPEVTTEEAWTMSRDGITVHAADQGIRVDDHGRSIALAWGDEAHLRNYTCASFLDRVAAAPMLAVAAWHPEVGRSGADGASCFDAGQAAAGCRPGRCMVVLRRVGAGPAG